MSFPTARQFSDDERTTLGALGELGAQALERARLFEAEQAARTQAARLHAAAAALAQAITPVDVVAAILDQGLQALGAQQGSVVLLAEDGATLETLGAVGYPIVLVDEWPRFPLSTPLPLAESVRTGELIVLSSREEANERYAALADLDAGAEFWVTVPLYAGGQIMGGLGFSAAEPRTLTDPDQQVIWTLARQCGQALQRARLFEAEQQANATLAAERDRIRQVLDVLPEGVAILDRQGEFVLLNQAGRVLVGRDPQGERLPDDGEEANPTAALRHVDGTPYRPDEQPLVRSLRQKLVVRGEQILLRQADTGRDVPLLMNSAPLFDADGTVTGAVAVFQDITPIKQLERAREVFVGATAHDLKTPLTNIGGRVDLVRLRLQRLALPEVDAAASQLARIGAEVTRMAARIDDLVNVTRAQLTDSRALNRQPTDLVGLAQAVLDQHQPGTRHALRLETSVPALVAMVDPQRIERVLNNLVGNAIKYSGADSVITVGVSRDEAAEGTWAVLTVADQGIGIPAEDLPHIFEHAYRAHNVTADFEGTGVGLSSVRQIVEQHGGAVTVESTVGIGTTAIVRLPLGPEVMANN